MRTQVVPSDSPTVVLVGRPNVGKSTLFNRLVGGRKAVVSATRGTTRDRITGEVEWNGRTMRLVDTGGFEAGVQNDMQASVQRHLRLAIEEADALVLLMDVREGPVPLDLMLLEELRRAGKPIVLAVNKAEDRPQVPGDFFALGIADTLAISGLHGNGTGDLLDRVLARVARRAARDDEERPAATVAIVGRQNVGKSSLFNALLREERVIVSEVPGTTRDAIDTRLLVDDLPVVLIDTAGLRHRRKVRDSVDYYSMLRSSQAIERCDVALVVLDGAVGLVRDDQRILMRVIESGRGLVFAVNKWDLVKGATDRSMKETIQRIAPYAAHAPTFPVSAKTGYRVIECLREVIEVARRVREGLPEEELMKQLRGAWASNPPPRYRGRTLKLKEAKWVAGPPARIELSTSPVSKLSRPYQLYLIKQLHKHPGLTGVTINLVVEAPETRRRNPKGRRGR